MSDPAELSLTDLAAAIRRRKVSSAEVTKALLARIKKWQPKINAFARVEAEDAMKAARAADRALANGKIRGPLHGVPLAHKDMYYVKGKLSECGSKIRKGWIAPATATALVKLEAAGAFRLGALNMVEFAFGPTGHNVHTGHVRNPWMPAHVTGGSSSGSGAAVGARLVPAALGSDTGGSIRLPAHFCGVTGLKTTNGRVSRANAMPLSFTLDTVGPLARTAEDCALIAAATAGPDPLDPTTDGAPAWDAQAAKRAPRGMTIGIPKSFYVDDLERDVDQALDDAIATFRKLGARIVQVDLPDQTLVSAAALIVIAVEAASYHAPWLRARAKDYGEQVRNRLINGTAYSGIEYLEALRWRGPALAAHLAAIGQLRRDPRSDRPLRGADHCGDRRGRRRECRGGDPRRHALHAAGQLPRPSGADRAGRLQQKRPADRAAAHRPAVPGRDADRARRGVPERNRLPHAGARTAVISFRIAGLLIGTEPGSLLRV